MSKVPESKPFRQVPTWDSTEKFELQGVELEALYNFFNIFAPAFTAIQQVFARGVQANKIKIGYEYEDGSPMPAEEVAAYTKSLNEYFKQKVEDETAARLQEQEAQGSQPLYTEPEEVAKSTKPTGKIVSFTGEPVETDA